MLDDVQALLAAGASTCTTPQALAAQSDVIILCVTGTPQVEAVLLGADGVLGGGDDVEFLGDPNPAWLAAWRDAAKQLVALKPNRPVEGLLTRRELVETVWAAAGKTNPLMLGASRLIREADYWAPNKERNVFANRGLAGIDGTLATAVGISLTP